MKKLAIAAALGLMIPLMSMGQTTLGPGVTGTSLTIAGLPHNFSGQTWNTYVDMGHGGQICQPCHTPHNANISVTIAPLWNHQFTTATYQMYTSVRGTAGTMSAVIDGTSKLCLSCHDGSVALGAFGGQAGGITMQGYNNGLANFGTDLRNDHPVSVDYNLCVTNGWGGLKATSSLYSTYTSPGVYGITTKAVSTKLDANGKVQCTSCHGAHSNKLGYQMSMSNEGSQICLICHSK